jgi:glycerol uptake facilitator-like aquaporin
MTTTDATVTGTPALEAEPAAAAPAPSLLVRSAAEFVGTALLLIAVVGSGIQAQRLSPSDTGLALLENSIATGGALIAIILALGPVSGAHLNPVVTLADLVLGRRPRRDVLPYIVAQFAGGAVGVILANLMFGLHAVNISDKQRSSGGLFLAEIIATTGLILVIFGVVRSGRATAAPYAVGAYIAGAYWFTASTSFANPAVTIARTLSDTFAGIKPADTGAFIGAQLIGAALAVVIAKTFYPSTLPES